MRNQKKRTQNYIEVNIEVSVCVYMCKERRKDKRSRRRSNQREKKTKTQDKRQKKKTVEIISSKLSLSGHSAYIYTPIDRTRNAPFRSFIYFLHVLIGIGVCNVTKLTITVFNFVFFFFFSAVTNNVEQLTFTSFSVVD